MLKCSAYFVGAIVVSVCMHSKIIHSLTHTHTHPCYLASPSLYNERPGNHLAYWVVVHFAQSGAYAMQTEIISAMNYACFYVQTKTHRPYFQNTIPFHWKLLTFGPFTCSLGCLFHRSLCRSFVRLIGRYASHIESLTLSFSTHSFISPHMWVGMGVRVRK